MRTQSRFQKGLLSVPFVALVLLGPMQGHAQSKPLLAPPVVPVEDALELDSETPSAPVPLPVAQDAPVADGSPLTEQERRAIAGLSSPAASPPQVVAPPAPAVHAPPANLTVKPGVNALFGVSESHTNRLVVPFPSTVIKTVSSATIEIDKANGLVYVQPNGNEPIGLFIYDEADPVDAISVTLVPADIPPVSVSLHLLGYHPAPQTGTKIARAGDRNVAKGWEADQPFTDTLKDLFRELALGRVPSGYSLSLIDASAGGLPTCVMPGLRVEPRQLLTGFNMNAVVAKVTNVSRTTLDVNETACHGADVVAVAAWPTVRLMPGKATELFIVVRAASELPPEEARPSLVGSAP